MILREACEVSTYTYLGVVDQTACQVHLPEDDPRLLARLLLLAKRILVSRFLVAQHIVDVGFSIAWPPKWQLTKLLYRHVPCA
jgi:hypothetical protein